MYSFSEIAWLIFAVALGIIALLILGILPIVAVMATGNWLFLFLYFGTWIPAVFFFQVAIAIIKEIL